MEQQFSDLETKNLELEKNMKDCHILLLDAKIDPGNSVHTCSVTLTLVRTWNSLILLDSQFQERVLEKLRDRMKSRGKKLWFVFHYFASIELFVEDVTQTHHSPSCVFQSVSTDLLNELKAFGDVVSQQQLRLQVRQCG